MISSAAHGYGTCEIDWTQALYSVPVKLYVISIFFFNFFVPLFVIVFTYVSIIRTVNSSHKSSRGGDISERQRKIERSITRVKLSPHKFPLIIKPKTDAERYVFMYVWYCVSRSRSPSFCVLPSCWPGPRMQSFPCGPPGVTKYPNSTASWPASLPSQRVSTIRLSTLA